MSARMRKPHIKNKVSAQTLYVIDNDVCYAIPKKVAKLYIVETTKAVHHEGNISADELFKKIDEEYGKAAALLKGVRSRENLSQVEFAKRINVSQPNLSKMEKGTRSIGKDIAKRIEKEFGVDYRYFLE